MQVVAGKYIIIATFTVTIKKFAIVTSYYCEAYSCTGKFQMGGSVTVKLPV